MSKDGSYSRKCGSPNAGNDTAAFEHILRNYVPKRLALDMRLISKRFLSDGMVPEAGDVDRPTAIVGRPLRSYRDFAIEVAASA